MQYIHVCPRCKKEITYKQKWSWEKSEKENSLCRDCKDIVKGEIGEYNRPCPGCGKLIYYKRKSDLNWAIKHCTKCLSCSSNSGKFKLGELHITSNNTSENNLDILMDMSLQSLYWVGFILADGSFSKFRFELGLQESDLEQLERFKKHISYNKTIKYRQSTKSYRISFSNRTSIPKFMQFFGIHYRKTYDPCDFSIFSDYSEEQLLAVLIGIVDGDGCISKTNEQLYLSITAHKNWEYFYQKLINKINIDFHINYIKNTDTICIKTGKLKNLKKLKQFILNNNLQVLDRKWNKIN